MSGLKYYFDLMSQPCRAVYIFLKYNGIPFTEENVKIHKGEHLTEQYRQVNAFQKLPAINDGGFVLTESIAILKYLSTKYSVPVHWYPENLQYRARIDEYLAWQHANTRFAASMYFQIKVFQPRITQKPVNTEKLELYRSQLNTVLDHIERVFLSRGQYMAGSEMTLADLVAVCELTQPMAAGLDITRDRPVLKTWMDRVISRLQPHFDDAHKFIWKVREREIRKANL